MRTERGDHLTIRDAPYLRKILDDDRPRHVCVKCAQSRMTITYLAKIFWRLCEKPAPGEGKARTCIYTFPTKEDVTQFSAARADPAIEASQYLTAAIGSTDNAGLKTLANGSQIYFRGTWTDRAAISVPADILAHDELDRSKPDTLQVYSDRTRASDDKRRYLFSSPTVPKYAISAHWERTDQQEWVWRCADCGHEQVFAPMDGHCSWVDQVDLGAKCFRCIACQAPVDPADAVRRGRWVAMAPGVEQAGYHITGIMPALASAADLAEAHREAEYEELFVQGHIGLPAVSGDAQITRESIAFGDWPNTLHSDAWTYAGLDQGKKLDFICGDGQGRIIAVHRFDDWDQVASAMRTLRVRLLVADAQPEPRPLQALAKQFPQRVKLADYSLNTLDESVYDVPATEPIRVRIHRTGAMDWGRDQLLMGADGGDVFPALPTQARDELVNMLCASMRTNVKDQHGQVYANWIETGPDHARHAHIYYLIAGALMGKRSPDVPAIWKNFGTGQAASVVATNDVTGETHEITPRQPVEPEGVLGDDGRPVAAPSIYDVYPALREHLRR
jgi:hypothetical protein